METQCREFEHESIRKSLDQAHEAASSISSLTLQLKAFESQFQSAKDSLLKQEQQLRQREDDVEIKLGKIKAREDEIQKQETEFQRRNSKNNKLISVEDEVEECSRMLITKRKGLALVQKEHQECIQDLAAKKKQLGSLMKSIEDYSKKIKSEDTRLGYKEKELIKVQKLIGDTSNELDLKEKLLEDKEKKYRAITSSIDRCTDELARKQKHLDSLKATIKKKTEELEAKEKKYDSINNSVNKCSAGLTVKQKELELIGKSIKESSSKLQLEEKKQAFVETYTKELAKTIEAKEKEFESLEEKMKTECGSLELKLSAVREAIRERDEELTLKEQVLKAVQMSIIESSKELEAMKKQEVLLETPISGCSEELESKKKHLDSVERSLEECCNDSEVGSKNVELHLLQGMDCGSSKELEEREEYLTLEKCSEKLEVKDRRCEACAKELVVKDMKIDSIQKLVDQLSKRLDCKEKELNDRFHSELRSTQLENSLAHCNGNSSTVDYKPCTTDYGRHLQFLLNECFRKHDSVRNKVFDAIQKSPDPGKLVLDAILGFYPTDLKEQDIEFDSSVIQRSCTALLELLLKQSPEIKPEVREEANKLALQWKSRMKTPCENSMEISGFLQLLAAFKLSPSFSSDELESLLDAIDQDRQALQLRQALGFAEGLCVSNLEQLPTLQAHEPENSSTATIDERTCPLILDDDMDTPDLRPDEVLGALKLSMDPAKFVLDMIQGSYSQHCKNGGGELDLSLVKSKILLMEQLIKVSPRVDLRLKQEAMKLAVLWKQNVTLESVKGMEVWAFLLFLNIYGLVSRFSCDEISRLVVKIAHQRHAPDICRFLGFTDKIPKVIQILIERKQHIEAARFSCAFGLVHIFPLDLILQNCVDYVWKDAKEKATEQEIHVRKAILQCISDYKMEQIYDVWNITRRIIELEKQRTSSMPSLTAPALFVQPQLQSQNVPIIDLDNCNSSSNNQPSHPPFVQKLPLRNQNIRDFQGNDKRPRIDISSGYTTFSSQSTHQ
ncbi:Frigida-like protein [Euphorbia peplus]|nr:Frigida-like protein [Euphorbia peplus]